MPEEPVRITYTRRLIELAREEPDRAALIALDAEGVERVLSRAALASESVRVARALGEIGLDQQSLLVLSLPNCAEHVILSFAGWMHGACVLPLSPALPATERAHVLKAAGESRRKLVIVGPSPGDKVSFDVRELFARSLSLSEEPLPDIVPHPGRAIASAGSTGMPKIIVDMRPHVAVTDPPRKGIVGLTGRRPGQTALVFGPLYHTLSYGTVFSTLFDHGCVVLMARFDAAIALDAIERFRVQALATVPAHLLRMARAFDERARDVSSLESVYHSGAVCPAWLKRRWIELVGATKLYEGFGSTEAVGMLVIRGDEWLEHPGSVGRGEITDVAIRDEHSEELPPGEVGEIFLRWKPFAGYTASAGSETYCYWGAKPARSSGDGFVSVGDLGWVDEDGYLFVADRRVDMIISGGVNVFPAEVESTLSEHPDVGDVVVIGVPDEEWGKRVHAIVQLRDPIDSGRDTDALAGALDRHCRDRLSPVKAPKTYEFVSTLPRNEAGKIRRSQLATERSA
jgi:bile acid-coenzyme A ligase